VPASRHRRRKQSRLCCGSSRDVSTPATRGYERRQARHRRQLMRNGTLTVMTVSRSERRTHGEQCARVWFERVSPLERFAPARRLPVSVILRRAAARAQRSEEKAQQRGSPTGVTRERALCPAPVAVRLNRRDAPTEAGASATCSGPVASPSAAHHPDCLPPVPIAA